MKIIVNNLAIEYQDKGKGPVLLLLHGWQDSLHSFDELTSLLSDSYRIVRLDLPGFGESEVPPSPWELNDYINLIKEFANKLGLQIYSLVGHSFGGRVIIKGIAQKRIRAEKVILIASAGIAVNSIKKSFIRLAAKAGKLVMLISPLSMWRNKARKKLYDKIGSDYLNSGPLKHTFINIINENLSSFAAKIKLPTLLVWGVNDTETPLSTGTILSNKIENSVLRIINNAGHFVHKEKAKEVSKQIREFLND